MWYLPLSWTVLIYLDLSLLLCIVKGSTVIALESTLDTPPVKGVVKHGKAKSVNIRESSISLTPSGNIALTAKVNAPMARTTSSSSSSIDSVVRTTSAPGAPGASTQRRRPQSAPHARLWLRLPTRSSRQTWRFRRRCKRRRRIRSGESLLLRPIRDLPLRSRTLHQVLLRATLEEPARSVELLFCLDLSWFVLFCHDSFNVLICLDMSWYILNTLFCCLDLSWYIFICLVMWCHFPKFGLDPSWSVLILYSFKY